MLFLFVGQFGLSRFLFHCTTETKNRNRNRNRKTKTKQNKTKNKKRQKHKTKHKKKHNELKKQNKREKKVQRFSFFGFSLSFFFSHPFLPPLHRLWSSLWKKNCSAKSLITSTFLHFPGSYDLLCNITTFLYFFFLLIEE